jgi:hypothetical protein
VADLGFSHTVAGSGNKTGASPVAAETGLG